MQQNPRQKRPLPPTYPIIITLDLDCFYASVAIRARPHLRDKPVAIVQKNLCVTSNYIARSWAGGAVQKMTPISKALRACPELVCIDGSDLTPFRAASLEVLKVIRRCLANRVAAACQEMSENVFEVPCQRLGFDEVFLDASQLVSLEMAARTAPWKFDGHVTGSTENDSTRRALMVASQIASALRTEVTAQTELSLCAGVSSNKLLAKLAVGMHKPNDQTTFLPDNAASYIAQLPPKALPGLGHGIAEKIRIWAETNTAEKDVSCVSDILNLFGRGSGGLELLSNILGSQPTAKHILALCRGQDESCVIDSGNAPKSMSAEDSCRSCTTMTDLRNRITVQTRRLVARLHEDGRLYSRTPRTLSISYRFRGNGFAGTSRSVPMPCEIVSVCCSNKPGTEEKAVVAIRRLALRVLRDQAGASESSPFNFTLIAIGASNFVRESRSNIFFTANTSNFFEHRNAPESGQSHETFTPLHSKKYIEEKVTAKAPKDNATGGSQCSFETSKKRTPTAKCPMCNRTLPPNNLEVNKHIDRCLGQSTDATTNNPSPRARKRPRTSSRTMPVDSFFRRV